MLALAPPQQEADVSSTPIMRAMTLSSLWQQRFVVLVLSLSMGAYVRFLGSSPEGNPKVQVLWTGLYVTSTLLFLRRRQGRVEIRIPTPILGLLGVAGASTVWSVAPPLTFQRWLALIGTTACALLLSTFPPREIATLVRRAAVLSASGSVLWFLAGHHDSLDPFHKTLRGVFVHRNPLGAAMALGLLCLLLEVSLGSTTSRVGKLCSAAVLAFALFESGSKTALLALIVGSLCVYAARLFAAPKRRLLGLTLVCVVGAVAVPVVPAVGGPDAVLSPLGRDQTLSGRVLLWQEVRRAISDHPWGGYGYSAFWDGPSSAVTRIQVHTGWEPAHAHSAVLESMLGLGLIGTLVFLFGFAQALIRSVLQLFRGWRDLGLLSLGVFASFIVLNAAEAKIPVSNSISTILFFSLAISLAGREPRRPSQVPLGEDR